MNGPSKNPIIVIIKEIVSKLPPTSIPPSPSDSSNSNKRESVISARATNPYRAPNVTVEESTKFGNLFIYLVAGA